MPKKTKSPKKSSQKLFKKHKNIKWLLPLLIFAAIVLFVLQRNINNNSVSIQMENKLNATANWKTYYNKENTYSFKYPANLYLYTSDPDPSIVHPSIALCDIAYPLEKSIKNPPKSHTLITIGGVYKNIAPTLFRIGSSANSSMKNFSINSYSGLRGYGASSGDIVYLNNPKGGWGVLVAQKDDNHIFDQILSTFKFTN